MSASTGDNTTITNEDPLEPDVTGTNTIGTYQDGNYYSTAFGIPWNNYARPCTNDPYYNCPPNQPCARNVCKKKCKKNCESPGYNPQGPCQTQCQPQCQTQCQPQCATPWASSFSANSKVGGCGPCTNCGRSNQICAGCGPGPSFQENPCELPKDPYPLKSFADYGLMNTCVSRPLINPFTPRKAVTTWKYNYIVANNPAIADNTDPELLDPWGMVIYNNQLWVVGSRSDHLINYDLFGNKIDSVITRDSTNNMSHPTGIAINCGTGFLETIGTNTQPATFVIATDQGQVMVYNEIVEPEVAIIVNNQQLAGEISKYKGIALTNGTIYLADFFGKQIDVYDSNYDRLLNYHFIDTDASDPIPSDYAPYNIVNIGPYLYVLYTRINPDNPISAIQGPGNGYISIFQLNGTFVRRFTSRGVLNNPWGMIPAPCECGFPPGSFVVSNKGDGRMNVFDCYGKYVGPILGLSGLPIIIAGLRAIVPHYTDFNEIYFTSSSDPNHDGLLGSIVRDQVIYF